MPHAARNMPARRNSFCRCLPGYKPCCVVKGYQFWCRCRCRLAFRLPSPRCATLCEWYFAETRITLISRTPEPVLRRSVSTRGTNSRRDRSVQAACFKFEGPPRIDIRTPGSSVKRRLLTLSPAAARSRCVPRRDLCSMPFQRLHLSLASSRATARSVRLVPLSRIRTNSFRRIPRSYSAQR
jgi:hypothetical protein